MDESLSSILLNRFLGPLLRTGLAGLFGILAVHGMTFDSALADDITKAALPLLAVLALSIWQKFQAAKVLQAGIAAQPGTPVDVVKAQSGTVPSALHLFAILLAFGIGGSIGCNKVPPNLTPTGAIAFRAVQVNDALTALSNSTKEADAQGVIRRDEAYKILDAVKVAALANNDLGHALQAGADAAGARDKAIAAINDVLQRLPGQLSPGAQKVAAPFIAAIQSILAAIGA